MDAFGTFSRKGNNLSKFLIWILPGKGGANVFALRLQLGCGGCPKALILPNKDMGYLHAVSKSEATAKQKLQGAL